MSEKYDVVIIGAGINGLAISKALAECNKKALVIEKKHIAAGASSHSSRLIHGGLRYLEHYEFSLVQEALHDQKYLLDKYPDLVKLRKFYLPLYKNSNRPVWMIRFGLWLYTLFSRHGEKSIQVEKNDFLQEFSILKPDDLEVVFQYFDAKTDDKALTLKVAEEAKKAGVEILEETKIHDIYIDDEKILIELDERTIQTQILVNASGAWIDEVNRTFKLDSSYTIEKLSGIHLVIDRVLVPSPLFLQSSSKRIFFIIPEKETTLIGTTERSERTDIDKIEINEEDIAYLLNESNNYLKKKLSRKDVKEVFIGVRPIIKSAKNPSKMSREYKLDLHSKAETKILHIYGGKLTTFPSLAKKVAKLLR